MNYLIDEGMVAGKGANTVISLLHHFLDNQSLGERSVHLHADNCSGQNKNNWMVQVLTKRDITCKYIHVLRMFFFFLMQYLVWRVLSGLH